MSGGASSPRVLAGVSHSWALPQAPQCATTCHRAAECAEGPETTAANASDPPRDTECTVPMDASELEEPTADTKQDRDVGGVEETTDPSSESLAPALWHNSSPQHLITQG
uniref:Uncharacterized protein n=1 Tax=Sphaerodactylus townsendi TaxID=933632 RepID=A0ACB8ER60_9SAUR